MWLVALLPAAIVLCLIFWKALKIKSFWPYVLVAGGVSWFGFLKGGVHPALALVPLAWCMPHEHTDLGIWTPGESRGKDTLNQMEHWWKNPVEIVLGLFGFRERRRRLLLGGPRHRARVRGPAVRQADRHRPS